MTQRSQDFGLPLETFDRVGVFGRAKLENAGRVVT
jgi:hypothetical protein